MELSQLILAHIHRLNGHVVEFGGACRARTGAWVCLPDPGAHTQGGHVVEFGVACRARIGAWVSLADPGAHTQGSCCDEDEIGVDVDMIDGMGAGTNLDLPQQNPRTRKS